MIKLALSLLFCVFIALPIFAAIAMVNRVLPHSEPETTLELETSDYRAPARDDSNPYSPPAVAETTVAHIVAGAVQEPSFLRACVIQFVIYSVSFFCALVASRLFGGIPSVLELMTVSFGLAMVTLVLMLPTTMGRAASICFCQLLMFALIAGTAYGLVTLLIR